MDSNSQIFDLNPLLPLEPGPLPAHFGIKFMRNDRINDLKTHFQSLPLPVLLSADAISQGMKMPAPLPFSIYFSKHLFFQSFSFPCMLALRTAKTIPPTVIGAHINKKHMPMAFGHHPFSIHYFSSMLRARSHLKCVRRPST